MEIGLKSGTVFLKKHNPHWSLLFKEEKNILVKILDQQYFLLEHIGSTSIPNIKAKPVIDILLVMDKNTDVEKLMTKLESPPYYKCLYQPHGETLFKKVDKGISTYYIHIVLENNNWQDYILFRDYLLENPRAANEYEELKIKLAKKFKEDRRAYTSAKEDFVEDILQKIKLTNKV